MKLEDVQAIARSKGISPCKLSKTRLIRIIQKNEGNFDCYATAYAGECNQDWCIWREDCFDAARKGELS